MGKVFPELDEPLRAWISAQRVFFVATAPRGDGGHINCSPKGLDSFRVLGPTTVAYLDYIGSGVETIAQVRENGRILITFCAFEGAPKIVRIHGRGTIVEPPDAEFKALIVNFDPQPGVRAIVRIEATRISDSCGFGVPLLRYEGERTQLIASAVRKGDSLMVYQREKNRSSIDGLPGLKWVEPGPAQSRDSSQ